MLWIKSPLGLSMLLLLGCASSGDSFQEAPGPRWAFTQDHLAETGARTALEAIEMLNPGLLLRMGQHVDRAAARPGITVYVDGVLQAGGMDALRSMPVVWVESIRIIKGSEARFQAGPGGGLIVTTVKAPERH